MMRPRVVIAGGAGFIGSHLTERFLAEGVAVTCIDNFCTGSPDNLAHLGNDSRLDVIEADVSRPVRLVGRVDAVMHLASPASPVHYDRLALETLRAGSRGTDLLLELAHEKEARFLLASTSEVYGNPEQHPQRESYCGNVDPVGPRSMYDEAKRYAEAFTTAARREWRVDAKIVRIFNTYGERMQVADGRVVPNFINQALTGKAITVAGDGSQTRSLCYVADLVDGLVRMLRSDLDGPVNLGNPHEMSVLEIAHLIRELAGSESPIIHVPRPPQDPQLRRPDITVATQQLHWRPNVEVANGLARTMRWFRSRLVPVAPLAADRSRTVAVG